MTKPIAKLPALYAHSTRWVGPVILSAILLLMRLIWGYQFFLAGKGKLLHIDRPIAFFTQLGIPAPALNAWVVAIVETCGGLLLLAGLGGRLTAFALTINMAVAYLTADHEAVIKLLSEGDPSAFLAAAPFWFLVTSVLVLALGPGLFSLDTPLKCLWCRRGYTTTACCCGKSSECKTPA